jgi:hypothetical protein
VPLSEDLLLLRVEQIRVRVALGHADRHGAAQGAQRRGSQCGGIAHDDVDDDTPRERLAGATPGRAGRGRRQLLLRQIE